MLIIMYLEIKIIFRIRLDIEGTGLFQKNLVQKLKILPI